MRKIENMMLTVFLVVSLICGKFLLDYWQDSYDNRQNYRQVEEIAFPEKDTQEEETEPNEDNPTTEIDDFDYQSLLDENADCIGWLKISDTDISYPVVLGEDNEFYLHHDFQKNYAICAGYFGSYGSGSRIKWNEPVRNRRDRMGDCTGRDYGK